MTQMPNLIRVGYRDYAVLAWDREDGQAAEMLGRCDSDAGRIHVDVTRDRQKVANVLLHELLHAAWAEANLQDEDDEERTVSGLANMMSQIWRDNPLLVEYITEALR